MKFILKILFAPVIAILAVVIWIFALMLKLSAWVFGIIGTIFGILGLAILLLDSVTNGIIVLVIAFLVSPIGLPMLAAWTIGQMQRFRYFVQDAIYGYYTMKNKVERGDIYWYNFGQNEGSVQNGIRPALVIQATNFNANSPTTIIAAITTAQKGMYLPSHIFLGERYGLDRPSTVMLEQIRTVNQNELGPYIGTVEDHATLNAISKALKKTYGLWVYHAPKDDVRCLCKRCLDEYRDSNEYIITRRDPFQKEKEPCDRCRHLGYDYILKHRRK